MDGKRRFSTGNKTVDAVGRMHFHGNIVPSAWYETIVKDTAGCDSIAMLILADIVYWYRPTEVRDERTGEVVGMRKKFRADMLQRSYKQLESVFHKIKVPDFTKTFFRVSRFRPGCVTTQMPPLLPTSPTCPS